MNNNKAFEFFQSFTNQENLTKSMKWMPNMDSSSFSDMLKETNEIISSSNQLISETVQSIAKRGSDSFQKNLFEMFNTIKESASAGDIEQIKHHQQNYLKSTVENNIDNAKAVLDIVSKSSMEILNTMSKNFDKKVNKPLHKEKV